MKPITLNIRTRDPIPIELTVGGGGASYYEGEYRVTPSGTAQVLATAGKMLAEDVTVDPIPSNYGLIAWNGSTLTVS